MVAASAAAPPATRAAAAAADAAEEGEEGSPALDEGTDEADVPPPTARPPTDGQEEESDKEGEHESPPRTTPLLEPEDGADLPGYVATPADLMLAGVYGDYVHMNDGTHLAGGVVDDAAWQRRWRRAASLPQRPYGLPKGKVGKRFLTVLVAEFAGVRERRWNSERPMLLGMLVLARQREVSRASDIRKRILQRMDLWRAGAYDLLLDDVELEARRQRPGPAKSDDTEARAFKAAVEAGRLRRAVRRLTSREGGRPPSGRLVHKGTLPGG